jgi:prevent-host-death family protein
MAEETAFQTLDVSAVQADLLRLLCRTAREKGRIEVTNCGGESCVVISKQELDSLEKALEILANTDVGKALCATVANCANQTEQPVAVAV